MKQTPRVVPIAQVFNGKKMPPAAELVDKVLLSKGPGPLKVVSLTRESEVGLTAHIAASWVTLSLVKIPAVEKEGNGGGHVDAGALKEKLGALEEKVYKFQSYSFKPSDAVEIRGLAHESISLLARMKHAGIAGISNDDYKLVKGLLEDIRDTCMTVPSSIIRP